MDVMTTSEQVEKSVGGSVKFRGMALDSKAGAVIRIEELVVFVGQLSAWPEAINGKQVIAEGRLVRERTTPDPIPNSDGLISQGLSGEQLVLKAAKWTVYSR